MTSHSDPHSVAGRIIRALRSQPEGAKFSTSEVCRLAGLPRRGFVAYVRAAMRCGTLICHQQGPKDFRWSVPLVEPGDEGETRALRSLMVAGDLAAVGDPLRGLVDAMDVARKVLAAKDTPGARFKGSEVDLLVARELRQIAEAAERARVNLMQALEVMS